MEHLALDPLTGKDPEDIRIRAAQGFEAADYFLGVSQRAWFSAIAWLE